MIVEITGAGFHNMGAELMLRAATNVVNSWEFVDGVAINFRVGTTSQRRKLGIGSVVGLSPSKPPILRRSIDLAVRSTPAGIKNATGVVHSDDGGALLDASGFAFGDQWGASAAERRAQEYDRYVTRGRSVVLLPQAFGPFTEPDVANASRRALNMAHLLFARDPESLWHIKSLGLTGPDIRLAPDFTNLLTAPRSTDAMPTVVVIPNYRLPEKVASVSDDDYTRFLDACITCASGAGFDVVVMAHEPGDVSIAERLADTTSGSIQLAAMDDPLAAKAVVGSSWLTISSRYHGAINSLSQCVPTIGTSWSHKYEHLFAAYGCEDGLWPIDTPNVADQLDEWLAPDERHRRAQRLEEPAASQKAGSEAMWNQVEAALRTET